MVGKETTMRWTSRFRSEAANLRDDPVFNRAPAPTDVRRRPETPAAPDDHPQAHIAEEIKRRQIALAVRYVVAVRAR
jgi:hypothetical protein